MDNTTQQNNIKSITIIGRRWFQRSYGNTYHTYEILINGECVHSTKGKQNMEYGYDSMYLQNATKWLRDNGYIPMLKPNEPLWYLRDYHGIAVSYMAFDVERERDL